MRTHPLLSIVASACVPAALFALIGCERGDPIHVSEVPKNPASVQTSGEGSGGAGGGPFAMADPKGGAQPAAGGAAEAPQGPGIEWDPPKGWVPTQTTGSMTFATYKVADGDPPVLMTVTPLGMQSGSLLMNVNRWEGQIGAPATKESDLGKVATAIKVDGRDAHLVNIVGPKAEGKPQMQMLAAVVPGPTATWYFKLIGPAEKVGPQKETFDAMVKSVAFKPGAMGPRGGIAGAGQDPHAGMKPPAGGAGGDPHAGMNIPGGAKPPAGGDPHAGLNIQPGQDPHAGIKDPHAGVAGTPAKPGETPKIEGLSAYKLPAGWQVDTTPRMMRAATLIVGADAEKAEVIVSRLGGGFGANLDNLNRWRGQVGLGPVADANDVKPETIKLDQGPVLLYDFAGPEGAGRKRQLVARTDFKDAAVVWFFRFVGPYETVTKNKPAFEEFVRSLKFEEMKAQ